jgi:hypothetical protein
MSHVFSTTLREIRAQCPTALGRVVCSTQFLRFVRQPPRIPGRSPAAQPSFTTERREFGGGCRKKDLGCDPVTIDAERMWRERWEPGEAARESAIFWRFLEPALLEPTVARRASPPGCEPATAMHSPTIFVRLPRRIGGHRYFPRRHPYSCSGGHLIGSFTERVSWRDSLRRRNSQDLWIGVSGDLLITTL